MISAKSFLRLVAIWICLVVTTYALEAIVGGQKAKEDQFPYQATLLDEGYDVCGGGIIADQFILTAAHCVIMQNGTFLNDRKSVFVGTNDLRKTAKPAAFGRVDKFYVPAVFLRGEDRYANDIAVIKLKHPLEMSKHIKKLKLPTKKLETYAGKSAKIAGFGLDWVNVSDGHVLDSRNSDTILRYAVADVLSQDHKGYEKAAVAQKQICARVEQYRFHRKIAGVCYGDSGSILVHDNTAIGILSTSPTSCSEQDVCALYTRVTHYLDFIHDAMDDRINKDILTHVLHP